MEIQLNNKFDLSSPNNTARSRKFSNVIFAYEHIRGLEMDLFRLRLKAINARILAISTGGKGAAGFGVVAEAILPFSNRMESLCQKLIDLCRNVLKLSSLNVKDSRNEQILKKTQEKARKINVPQEHSFHLNESIANVENELSRLISKIEEEIKSIRFEIQKALRLCLDGQMISIQIKIESTYVSQNISDFKTAASAFSESLENIQSAIRTIQKDW